jgi:hypothetical protein
LVLGYVRGAGQANPEVLMRAESLVNVGYQRLLAFQRPDGGFDWWGRDPGLTFLTAYAVQEFHDMGKVYDVDPKILEKARNFLFAVQEKDGSWARPGATHGLRVERLPPAALTAYVAWSILETGFKDPRLDKAAAWLEEHAGEAGDDPYVLALVANAFVARQRDGAAAKAALEKLAGCAEKDGDRAFWRVKGQTMYYGGGNSGDVETTALAAHALIRGGRHPDLANRALAFLVAARDGSGAWGSTQATILALKAILLASTSQGEAKTNAEITVEVNGVKKHVIVTPDNWDVLQIVDFKEAAKKGDNEVLIRFGGEVNLSYQVVGRHFIPWSKLPKEEGAEPIQLAVEYDRTSLTTHDVIRATARMKYNAPGSTFMVIVTLGLPPGFIADPGDFAEMVGMRKIQRYDLNPRQATLYLGDVKTGQEFEFVYHLTPKYPIKAKTARSTAYEYYNPDRRAIVEPEEIEVK